MASVKGEKIWADAIRKAVHCYMDVEGEDGFIKKVRVLNQLAVTVCRSAAKGDIAAIKEVGDRLDGKPAQAVAFSGDVKVTGVTEKFVLPDGERYSSKDSDPVRIPTTH